MVHVEYPECQFRTKKEGGRDYIFDKLRKKWVSLTPEEWVRQNFVQYLVRIKNYPATLIAQEKVLELGELKKRFDILVYDRNHEPWMMIECKAPPIKLDDNVVHQVLRYNISIPVEFIIITNGDITLGWKREDQLLAIQELPSMQQK